MRPDTNECYCYSSLSQTLTDEMAGEDDFIGFFHQFLSTVRHKMWHNKYKTLLILWVHVLLNFINFPDKLHQKQQILIYYQLENIFYECNTAVLNERVRACVACTLTWILLSGSCHLPYWVNGKKDEWTVCLDVICVTRSAAGGRYLVVYCKHTTYICMYGVIRILLGFLLSRQHEGFFIFFSIN